jgi:hypothetical protein
VRTYRGGVGGDEFSDGLGVVASLDGAGNVWVGANGEGLLNEHNEVINLNLNAHIST